MAGGRNHGRPVWSRGAVGHCLCSVFPLISWLRHCLGLCISTACRGYGQGNASGPVFPLPFVAETAPFPCGLPRRQRIGPGLVVAAVDGEYTYEKGQAEVTAVVQRRQQARAAEEAAAAADGARIPKGRPPKPQHASLCLFLQSNSNVSTPAPQD